MWEGLYQVIACTAFALVGAGIGFVAGCVKMQAYINSKTIDVAFTIVRRDYMGCAIPFTRDGMFVITHDYNHAAEVAKRYGYGAKVMLVSVVEE